MRNEIICAIFVCKTKNFFKLLEKYLFSDIIYNEFILQSQAGVSQWRRRQEYTYYQTEKQKF